ncbi:MAG: HlyD family secretion protein [Saprospiraceae bacterium]
MRTFAAYFVLAFAVFGALAWVSTMMDTRKVEEFYGFAETDESEINFNYPVEIQKILVQAGDEVKSGQSLLIVKRARSKDQLADQGFRIDELRAESTLTKGKLSADIDQLGVEYERDLATLRAKRSEIASEAKYREQLLNAVLENPTGNQSYSPVQEQLDDIDRQLTELERSFEQQRDALAREQRLSGKPFDVEMSRLRAEQEFDAAQEEVIYEIKAPSDGVIGSINAKISEHKSSFSPLINFYEPNPSQVKGYIHEDRILEAKVGDKVKITSLTSPETNQEGVITGLGSRIVEIPSRLRRMVDFKTYGREILISIPSENPFLQKEKVVLTFLDK